MRLWLLTNTMPIGWDDMEYIVVRATDEAQAREIATKNCVSEGGVWGNENTSVCEELMQEGEAGMIVRDVNWG